MRVGGTCGSGSEVSGILEQCRGSWFHLGSILHVRSQPSTTSLLAVCTTEPVQLHPAPLQRCKSYHKFKVCGTICEEQ